jgi:ADP-heptose:LPS heptosyltransferase
MPEAKEPRALICMLPGLGDAMMASPIVRSVSTAGYVMDALTMLRPVTEYASALGCFERVDEVPLLQGGRSVLSLLALRRRRYDLVFVPAPAARWQYAAVALAVGGRTTVVHRYGGMSSAITRFGGMKEVELRGGHRISENRRLIESIGMRCDDATYLVPESWKAHRRQPGLLGLHVGSMSYKGNEQKRWPLECFAEIARRHIAQGFAVRAFFGPNELGESEALRNAASGVEIVELPLAEAARALSECEVVLANDSGLAHLSAGLGVMTLVLFGMTDPTRCKPVGPAIALRPSSCPPCFDEGLRRFTCVRKLNYRCLNDDMSVEIVWRTLQAMRARKPVLAASIEQEGPFSLYGRAHA